MIIITVNYEFSLILVQRKSDKKNTIINFQDEQKSLSSEDELEEGNCQLRLELFAKNNIERLSTINDNLG